MTFDEVVTWWQSKSCVTASDYKEALKDYQIMFTCNSHNIEGGKLTPRVTKEVFTNAPITEVGVLPRDIFEAMNQRFAFDRLISNLVSREPITLELVRKLHKSMLYGSYDGERWEKGERPGKFKIGDYCVGMTEEGTPPEDVEEELQELFDEVNQATGDPMTVATYLHVRFACIHPFSDGNGRVGRTLLNYYLMLKNYPPMVIFDQDKETYFLGLEVYDRTGEISGLRVFFKEQVVKTWESVISDKGSEDYSPEFIDKVRRLAPRSYAGMSDKDICDLLGEYVRHL